MYLHSVRPEEKGLSPSYIVNFLDTCEKEIHYLYNFGIVKDNNLIAEGYYKPIVPGIPRIMHSISKSVLSLAIGIIIDEGKLGLKDKVLVYFRDKLPKNYDKRLEEMRVEHLLMMSASSAYTSASFVGEKGDWLTHYFSLPLYSIPEFEFHYDTGASYVLSCLVTKITGQNTFEFLRDRVFKFMDIKDVFWLSDSNGNSMGGWGLYLKFSDMLKIGTLFINYGKWKEKQLIPEWWMKEATSHKIETKNDPGMGWSYGYGYQFWLGPNNIFLAFGVFGQLIVCEPTKRIFIVTAGGCSEQETQKLLGIISDTIISPTLNHSIPYQDKEYKRLVTKISKLSLPFSKGSSKSNFESKYFKRTYILDFNKTKFKTIGFVRKNKNTIELHIAFPEQNTVVVNVGYKNWITNVASLDTNMHTLHSFSYAWENDKVLVIIQYLLNTSFSKVYRFTFFDDKVMICLKLNESLYEDLDSIDIGVLIK